MCAQPGGKEYSAYTVAVQYYGETKYVIKVPPKAFNPPPKVSSAIVRLDRRVRPPVVLENPDFFFFMVHAMFTHRRKTVRRCLQGSKGVPAQAQWDQALEKAGIDSQRRPETLSLEDLAAIVRALGGPDAAVTFGAGQNES
jgi:16S rRNA (adenine1518-N6/adenine1519-N6)-dimethyltransferase